MSVPPGSHIGAYEITGLLGAGGMGEVYRARDTRLHRDVALKVLPETFAADPDRLARFKREAQLLAALNHPHIAGIYGLEEASDVTALVLELVEGPTLAERIAKGPIAVDEALPMARQIAEALQAAHESGIIHRDLKPANIKVRPDGDIKVLDFGLAKMLEPEGVGSMEPAATHSPTLSLAATQAGVILGTAAYMPPEQAKGRIVDKRSDVWAFGCVLYEMLTGKRAFDGEDVTDTLANVLKIDPEWQALPADLPLAVRTLLRRCLEKDRRKRIVDLSTVLFVLDEVAGLAQGPADVPHSYKAIGSRPRWRTASIGTAALLLAAVGAGSAVWVFMRPAPPRVIRTTMTPPEAATLRIDGNDRDLVITPDGTRVVYAGGAANSTQIFVRSLDQLEPTVLVGPIVTTSGGGGAQGLCTSPDGQWVGYVDNNTILKKVAVTGGPPVLLLTMDGNSRGVTWVANDVVVFATAQSTTGLQSVPAGGGSATVLTRPDGARGEADHLWPEALPDGRHLLFTITAVEGGLDAAQIAVMDLASGSYKTVVRGGSHAHYVASGHLVYAAAGTLRAVPFDPRRLETRGTPVPVLPRLLTTTPGAADFSVAADGTLVYVDAPSVNTAERMLVWVDRQGMETPLGTQPRAYQTPRLSPDGTRVAVASVDQEQDLWIWDLARATLTRLTFETQMDIDPVWTPDGRRVVFASGAVRNLYIQAADNTGTAERLTESSNHQGPSAITPDGTSVVFEESGDIRLLTLPPPRRPAEVQRPAQPEVRTLIGTRFVESHGVISPDGRWLAYQSNASGRREVYVRPFPNVDAGQWQVSTEGGDQPLWARSGRELFYVAPGGVLMVVSVQPTGAWSAGNPAKLLESGGYDGLAVINPRTINYDLSPDGRRFLMVKQSRLQGTAARQIVVVQNWLEELKRLVPTN